MIEDVRLSCKPVCADMSQEMKSMIRGIEAFIRLTNVSCFIVDFDSYEIVFKSKHLLYVDKANDGECLRECKNPYWSMVSEEVFTLLQNIKRQYAEVEKTIDSSTRICVMDFPIVLGKREFYINQKFTSLTMHKDGVTRFGLFTISPSSSDHMQCVVIAEQGARWIYDFERGKFVMQDCCSVLSEMENAILQYVRKGKTIKEISDIMSLSASTIKTHRARLFRKLEATTMQEALTKIDNYRL